MQQENKNKKEEQTKNLCFSLAECLCNGIDIHFQDTFVFFIDSAPPDPLLSGSPVVM